MAHILVVVGILLSLLAPVVNVRPELTADPLDSSLSIFRAKFAYSGLEESLAYKTLGLNWWYDFF